MRKLQLNKEHHTALACVAQLAKGCAINRKAASSTPGQGACLGFGPTDQCVSPHSLKSISMSADDDKKKKKEERAPIQNLILNKKASNIYFLKNHKGLRTK